MGKDMKLTKEDLLLAAEAAKLWPGKNFNRWTNDDPSFLTEPIKKGQIKPGYA